ncbi:MAG: ATP-grasp domain-containing protein [Candidatus Odinarchaeia archaeon]
MVYEHASGGGYCSINVKPSLFSEGYGMLNSTLQDFQRFESDVYTTLDYRIANFTPLLRVNVITILRPPQDILTLFGSIIEDMDQILLIAPEQKGILYKITKIAENKHLIILGSSSEAIKMISNKYNLQVMAKNLGLNVPESVKISFNRSIDEIKEIVANIGYPSVFRSLDSVGGSGVYLVKDETELERVILELKHSTEYDEFLAHKYINGIPASVSLISNGMAAKPISLNAQAITFDRESGSLNYLGGYIPLKYRRSTSIKRQATQLIENISGLRGFIGVDLIIGDDDQIYFLEVNPRITTSYVGLRKIVDVNLMDIVRKAVVEGELPAKVKFKGYAFFSKVRIYRPNQLSVVKIKDLAKTDGIISPPFPTGLDYLEALIVSEGKTLNEAKNAYVYMKKSVESIGTPIGE